MDTDPGDLDLRSRGPVPMPRPVPALDGETPSAPPPEWSVVPPRWAAGDAHPGRAPDRHPPDRHRTDRHRTDRRRARRSRRRLVVAGAMVTLALAAVAAGVGWSAHDNLARSDSALAASRFRLDQNLARLARARAALASVSGAGRVEGMQLATAQHQLAVVQSDLAKDQADEVTQGVNISDLDQCLTSVEVALNEVSLGQSAAAATTLQSAGPVCQAAHPAG